MIAGQRISVGACASPLSTGGAGTRPTVDGFIGSAGLTASDILPIPVQRREPNG